MNIHPVYEVFMSWITIIWDEEFEAKAKERIRIRDEKEEVCGIDIWKNHWSRKKVAHQYKPIMRDSSIMFPKLLTRNTRNRYLLDGNKRMHQSKHQGICSRVTCKQWRHQETEHFQASSLFCEQNSGHFQSSTVS